MLTKDAIIEKYPNGQVEWHMPIEWHAWRAYRRHGESIQYYPTGEVKLRRTYEHGKEVGREIIYYRDGSVMSTVTFVDGRPDGKHTFTHKDGSTEEAKYVSGALDAGSIKRYDQRGRIINKRQNAQPARNPGTQTILPGDNVPPALAR